MTIGRINQVKLIEIIEHMTIGMINQEIFIEINEHMTIGRINPQYSSRLLGTNAFQKEGHE